MLTKTRVSEVQRSSSARRAELEINKKIIMTPLYGCMLKRKFELDIDLDFQR